MKHTYRINARVLGILTGLALVGSLLVCAGRATAAPGVGQCPINDGVALLWDRIHYYFAGEPFVPSEPPVLGADWVPYQHPAWPGLRFLHPPDWNPITIFADSGHTIGVDLIRTDSDAAWQYLSTWNFQGATARQWVNDSLRAVIGLAPHDPWQVLCENELPAFGVFQHTSVLVVSADPLLAIGFASIVSDGLSTYVFYRAVMGPAQEFTQLTNEIFLALDWQMVIN
jgi:hypothetical protein